MFCSTPAVGVGRNVSRKHAMELLLTGKPIDAATALAWGLVNRVVAAEKLDEETGSSWRSSWAGARPSSRRASGRSTGRSISPWNCAYDTAGATMVRNLSLDDAAEGIGAFLGKRAPAWKGA